MEARWEKVKPFTQNADTHDMCAFNEKATFDNKANAYYVNTNKNVMHLTNFKWIYLSVYYKCIV